MDELVLALWVEVKLLSCQRGKVGEEDRDDGTCSYLMRFFFTMESEAKSGPCLLSQYSSKSLKLRPSLGTARQMTRTTSVRMTGVAVVVDMVE